MPNHKQQILINNSNRIDTGSVELIKELRKAGIIKSARKRRAPKEILAVNDATGGASSPPMYRTVMQAPTDVYQRIPDRENPQLRRVGPNDLGANQQNVDVVQQLDAGQNVYGDAPVRGREQGLPEAQRVFGEGDDGIRPPEARNAGIQANIPDMRDAGMQAGGVDEGVQANMPFFEARDEGIRPPNRQRFNQAMGDVNDFIRNFGQQQEQPPQQRQYRTTEAQRRAAKKAYQKKKARDRTNQFVADVLYPQARAQARENIFGQPEYVNVGAQASV